MQCIAVDLSLLLVASAPRKSSSNQALGAPVARAESLLRPRTRAAASMARNPWAGRARAGGVEGLLERHPEAFNSLRRSDVAAAELRRNAASLEEVETIELIETTDRLAEQSLEMDGAIHGLRDQVRWRNLAEPARLAAAKDSLGRVSAALSGVAQRAPAAQEALQRRYADACLPVEADQQIAFVELLETAARDNRRSDEVLDTMRRVSSSLGRRPIAERMADLDQDVGRVMAAVQALRHQVDALTEAAPTLAREGECAVGSTLW